MSDDFVLVEFTPINIKKKCELVQRILKEFNIKQDRKNNTLFYKELANLRIELVKYLKTCSDPLDETIRLIFSTFSQTIKQFTKDKKTISYLRHKELFGNFFEDDEFYGIIGEITYHYASAYKVKLQEILFSDFIPPDCNLIDIVFYILSNLQDLNYSNFILLSIKMKIIKLKVY